MTNFEEELKRALGRQSPPADFTTRVLAAVEERESARQRGPTQRWLLRIWKWRVVPTMAGVLAFSAGTVYWRHERTVRGEEAKKKLLIAIHIAGAELQQARQRVLEIEGGRTK